MPKMLFSELLYSLFLISINNGISAPVKIPTAMIIKWAIMINNSLEGPNIFNKCRKTTAKPPIIVNNISTFNKVNTGLRINFFSIRKEPIPIENIYNPTVTLYLKTVFSRKADKDWASNNSYMMLQKAKTKVIVKRMAKIPLNLLSMIFSVMLF